MKPAFTRRSLLGAALTVAWGRTLGAPAWAGIAAPLASSSAVFHADLGSIGPEGAAAHTAAGSAGGWVTSAAVRVARFELLGVEWLGPADAVIEVRARLGRRPWSEWTAARSSRGHAPDGPSGDRLITDPVWSGAADTLQVRASRPLRGVRVHLVDATGAGRGRRGRAAAARLARPTAAAATGSRLNAGPGQPSIIARSAWAGGSERPRVAPSYGQVELGFVHHTVNANGYAPGDVATMIRAIFHYHRDVQGWNDIGYNFLVDRFGRIFEGREGGIDESVVGAQAGGYNAVSTGVGSLGDFMSVSAPAAVLGALANLLAWKLSLHGVPVTGTVTVRVSASGAHYTPFAPNAPVTLKRISGHRDGDSTDCPGNALYGQLPGLREACGSLAGRAAQLTIAPRGATGSSAPAVQGGLAYLDGRPIAGVPVLVLAGARVLATATTGPDGGWSATLGAAGASEVRAVFRGDGQNPASVSPRVALRVTPTIAITGASPAATPGGSVLITGGITPVRTHISVLVARQSATGAFTPVRQARHNAPHGRIALPVTFAAAGRYEVVVSTPADRSSARGQSNPVYVTVA
jgi:N-acetylmuramoyl-L-alanine amidase